MTTPHTPGPWRIEQHRDGITIRGTCNSAGGPTEYAIADVRTADSENGYGVCGMEGESNARLIAAAPDLLEACQYALGQLEGSKPQSGVHCASLKADIEIVKAAISKATGSHP